jgi:hypothetical protein
LAQAAPVIREQPQDLPYQADPSNPFSPFLNATVYRLMHWYYRSTTKSPKDLQHLGDDVLLADDFNTADLCNFTARCERERMDKPSAFAEEDGWKQASVALPVPAVGVAQTEDQAGKVVVGPFWYKTLCSVIRAALREDLAKSFHVVPFKQYWKPMGDAPTERVYSESYTADVYHELYAEVATRPSVKSTEMGVMILVLMLWSDSDSTHLANFGTSSLWLKIHPVQALIVCGAPSGLHTISTYISPLQISA